MQLKVGDVHALLGVSVSLTTHPAGEIMLAGFSLLIQAVGSQGDPLDETCTHPASGDPRRDA